MAGRYNEVADSLRQSILSGKIIPGSQLPTERELCDLHRVSRITIRHALRLLEEERLIQRHQGSGTFVSPKPSRRIPLMIDYTGSIRAHAPLLRRSVRRWLWSPASDEIAADLALQPKESVLYAERVDDLEGKAVAWDQVFIPRSFGDPLTVAELAKVDFLETWTRCAHFEIVNCRQTIEAVAAGSDDSRKLAVKSGQPLLKSTEVYYTLRQRPAGLFVSYYHPGYVCISSQYQWQDRPAISPTAQSPRKTNSLEKS
jgi:GntR family transcriptional regulator